MRRALLASAILTLVLAVGPALSQVVQVGATQFSLYAVPVTGVGYTVTAGTLATSRTLTVADPGANDTFVFLGATQTLTNKTLGTGTAIGPGGTVLTNGIVKYSPTLTPTATTAAIQTATQTFTVTGLATADTVYVNGPAPTSLCPLVAARASAANTLALDFTVLTAAACTPASGAYSVVAIR